jgi:hypothetical protein
MVEHHLLLTGPIRVCPGSTMAAETQTPAGRAHKVRWITEAHIAVQLKRPLVAYQSPALPILFRSSASRSNPPHGRLVAVALPGSRNSVKAQLAGGRARANLMAARHRAAGHQRHDRRAQSCFHHPHDYGRSQVSPEKSLNRDCRLGWTVLIAAL